MFGKGEISIKLLESDRQIEDKIYKSLAKEVNDRIKKRQHETKKIFKGLIEVWIRSQPEIASLSGAGVYGSLNAQYGFPHGGVALSAIDQVVFSVLGSMSVSFKPVNSNLKGGLEFSFQPKDFLNLLGLKSGHILTEKGGDLHWLDWLLVQGDKTIVVGYSYVPAPTGRSGGGEMNIGGLWRVPPEFSGTLGNNFITRSFENREDEIMQVLKGLII